jgi:ethanolamine utilization protein EutA
VSSPSETSETLTSVGIDVGTTTTQVVVSDLEIRTTGAGGAARPEIVERTVRHRGAIHETPLSSPREVDAEAVAALVEEELEAAGLRSEEIDTGAVIVTGEAARKRNAEALVRRLAGESGRFVAASAGAALEAILAGRGSGAAALAEERGERVANADVGGATTNVAVFEGGTVRETRCLDVGGRLVSLEAGVVTDRTEPARRICEAIGLGIEPGDEPTADALQTLCGAMADRIVDCLRGPPYDALTRELAIGSLPDEPVEYDTVVVTGGVGRLLEAEVDPEEYGDLGPLLAAALSERIADLPVRRLAEDVRATVVGAGSHATTLSGRTVRFDADQLPLRDLPVVSAGDCSALEGGALCERLESAVRTATERHPEAAYALAIDDVGSLSYDRLSAFADALASAIAALDAAGDGDCAPAVLVTRQNCAKALGGAFARRLDGAPIAIDEVVVADGDYLDVGEPVGGGALTVVVKTLAFDSSW